MISGGLDTTEVTDSNKSPLKQLALSESKGIGQNRLVCPICNEELIISIVFNKGYCCNCNKYFSIVE